MPGNLIPLINNRVNNIYSYYPRNEPLWAYLSYRPTIGGAENGAYFSYSREAQTRLVVTDLHRPLRRPEG